MFKEKAILSGLYKGSPEPLPRIHAKFYDRYVRGTQGSALDGHGTQSKSRDPSPFETTGDKERHQRTRSTLQTMNQKRLESYIPLRELMRHNHEERVHSYLKKLNEEEAEKMRASKAIKAANEEGGTRRSGE